MDVWLLTDQGILAAVACLVPLRVNPSRIQIIPEMLVLAHLMAITTFHLLDHSLVAILIVVLARLVTIDPLDHSLVAVHRKTKTRLLL